MDGARKRVISFLVGVLLAGGVLFLAVPHRMTFLFGKEGNNEARIENSSLIEAPRVGFLAPEFRTRTLRGEPVSLSQYRGKVLLVNFWATWCEPCKEEMPSMEALYKSLRGEDFEILAVSIDLEGEGIVKSFVKEFGFTFPILLDKNLFIVEDTYQVRFVPASFLIDKKGIITHRISGWRDWNSGESKELIRKLIRLG